MNRRGFFGTIGKVSAGFMILPGAGRVWKAVVDERFIRVAANVNFSVIDYSGEWYWFKDNRFVRARKEEIDKELYKLERFYENSSQDRS